MSYSTSIVSGTLNVTFNMDPPVTQDPLRLVIYNQSPFILQIETGLIKAYCAAFTADIYDLGKYQQKVRITPIGNIGADFPLANQIFGVFFADFEALPFATFPASLFGSPESLAVDNPTLLAFEFARTVPFTGSAIDVRKYVSYVLSIQYDAANAGPPPNTAEVTLEWGDTASFGNILKRRTIEFHSVNSTDCGKTVVTDPVGGPFMRYSLRAANGPASTVSLVLYGSSRPVDKLRIQELGPTINAGMSTDRWLSTGLTALVAAGATLRINVRIGSGMAWIFLRPAAAGGPWSINLKVPSMPDGFPFTFTGIAASQEVKDRLMLPLRCMIWEFTNNHATTAGQVRYALVAEDT